MSDRIELNNKELEDVVGGALRWCGGRVWWKGDSSVKYKYDNYEVCLQWLRQYWGGQEQDASALEALEQAGLIHKV